MSDDHQHDDEHGHAHTHQSHEAIIKRLKRADGHLRSIITMIEEGRECVDIAQQLHAVEKAVCQAKRTLIQDHMTTVLRIRLQLEQGRSIGPGRIQANYQVPVGPCSSSPATSAFSGSVCSSHAVADASSSAGRDACV
jgi:DNA-binding FrmR family transcriptional regulator